jgi:hypothetical protein
MHRFVFLTPVFLFLSFSGRILAQDERYFRQIFTGELGNKAQLIKRDYKWEVSTPAYKLDLDGDGEAEGITISKKDGENWIELSGKLGKPFFRNLIPAIGIDSSLFKINFVTLSPTVKVLLLHFYEGYTNYLQFNGTARVFLLSFENNKLDKISVTTGPSFWIEREKIVDQYFKRLYKIDVIDLNNDSLKEITVSFNRINRTLTYMGNGRFIMP